MNVAHALPFADWRAAHPALSRFQQAFARLSVGDQTALCEDLAQAKPKSEHKKAAAFFKRFRDLAAGGGGGGGSEAVVEGRKLPPKEATTRAAELRLRERRRRTVDRTPPPESPAAAAGLMTTIFITKAGSWPKPGNLTGPSRYSPA